MVFVKSNTVKQANRPGIGAPSFANTSHAGLLPNLIIAGAPKSGTSSVFRWLADHPQILGSTQKETYYFVDPGTHMFDRSSHFLNGGLDGYRRFFPAAGRTPDIIVEATPSYIYSDCALTELPRLPSQPHFLFLLREPVSQLYSLFRYFQSNWDWIPSTLDFAQYLDACRSGTADFNGNELAKHALGNAAYVEHLARWRSVCGRDRLHVYLFEEAFADKRRFMRLLAEKLGIAGEFYDNYHFPTENQTYSVRSNLLQQLNIRLRSWIPQGAAYTAARSVYRRLNTRRPPADIMLDEVLERQLSEWYAPFNERLSVEYGVDTGAWDEVVKLRRSAVGIPSGGQYERR